MTQQPKRDCETCAHAALAESAHPCAACIKSWAAGDGWSGYEAAPAASQEAAPADPMDWPLPCDVRVGHGTMRKGVKLRTLVARMKVLYEMATGENADAVAARKPEQGRALLDEFLAAAADAGVTHLSAQQAAQPPQAVEPLFLLHCGQIDGGGEQDDWDIEADSGKRVEEFALRHPGQTIKLYPAAPTAQPLARLTDEQIGDIYTVWRDCPGASHADLIRAVERAIAEANGKTLGEVRCAELLRSRQPVLPPQALTGCARQMAHAGACVMTWRRAEACQATASPAIEASAPTTRASGESTAQKKRRKRA